MKKKNGRRRMSVVRQVLLAVCVAVFLYSGYMLLNYDVQKRESVAMTEDLIRAAVSPAEQPSAPEAEPSVPEAEPSTSDTEPSNPETVPTLPEGIKDDPATELAPLEVDFDILNARIKNAVAWVYCPNTVVHYPVMQAQDNQYYVKHLPDGKAGHPGSIFMDFRNAPDFSDCITVLYGHNMRDGSMFALLQNYREQAYYDLHPAWYIFTPDASYKVNLVAGYIVPHDSATYQVLNNQEERDELIEYALDNSCFKAQQTPPEDAQLVCFSTCAYDFNNARFVLMGYLESLD